MLLGSNRNGRLEATQFQVPATSETVCVIRRNVICNTCGLTASSRATIQRIEHQNTNQNQLLSLAQLIQSCCVQQRGNRLPYKKNKMYHYLLTTYQIFSLYPLLLSDSVNCGVGDSTGWTHPAALTFHPWPLLSRLRRFNTVCVLLRAVWSLG